jgi:hypothetical protein
MSDQPDALRQAAAMLLNAAPAGAVIRAVRSLLDAMEADRPGMSAAEPAQKPPQAARAGNGANAAPTPRPAPAPATPPAKARSGAEDAERESWERLRQEVRTARQARGLTMAQLADALGMARATTKTALTCRRPPSARLQTRLTEWLAAPAVAVPDATFRRNGRDGTARSTANGAAEHAAD